MKRKILIEKTDENLLSFLIENDEAVEIHCSDISENASDCRLGNIYIGKVKNIVQNIGAAFIEIKNGVNCYYDMKDAPKAIFTSKIGNKPLCIGDELVVQVNKEAVKTKAPTVTSNLSFSGRYAVITHGNTRIGVSSKVPGQQRAVFKEQLKEFRNDRFGIIVRTNARNADIDQVMDEIESLKAQYESIKAAAMTRTCFSCLKSSPPEYITDLKNVYMDGMEEIVVNDKDLYEDIQSYFEKEMPDKTGLIRLYDNDYPMSKLYSTQTILENALKEKVWLKHGGYLIIQPTEALTVIDVNSGKNTGKSKEEEGIIKINLEAAAEAAKQIRLRNLSGIIIIDFINMENADNLEKLTKRFRELLAKDPIQTTLVDVTLLNLVEVTRKKVHRPLYEQIKKLHKYR